MTLSSSTPQTLQRSRVFGFGSAVGGQLGIKPPANSSYFTPVEVEFQISDQEEAKELEDISAVQTGEYHSAILTADGSVYTMGCGENGKLGHNNIADYHVPTRIASLVEQRIVVVSLACGDKHTVLATDKGQTFTFGCGKYGRLGHNIEEDVLAPRIVTHLETVSIVSVAAGRDHTMVLSGSGQVYTMGCGVFGRLGHNSSNNYTVPTLVQNLSHLRATQISAGSWHNVVLIDDGGVYCFGQGEHGRLGNGSSEDAPLPTKMCLSNLEGKAIKQIDAGGLHTVLLTVDGNVYTCGWGACGQLGHPMMTDVKIPTRVQDLTNIESISAGYIHTVAFDADNVLHCFGNGKNGQLGLGEHVRTAAVPGAVKLHDSVVQVSAGDYHTLILCGKKKQASLYQDMHESMTGGILTDLRLRVPLPHGGFEVFDLHKALLSRAAEGNADVLVQIN